MTETKPGDWENVWKSEKEITLIKTALSLIFSQNTGLFEKYVQTLVKRFSSDFKSISKFVKKSISKLVKKTRRSRIFNSSRCLEIGEVLTTIRV